MEQTQYERENKRTGHFTFPILLLRYFFTPFFDISLLTNPPVSPARLWLY